tara:strand:- start:3864 stop:5003 length:1140 start_codon:yes stop_codon:yes gene_type:complete
MPGVSYALADFVTGGPIIDLPVMEGANWAALLNRPDILSCTVDLRDIDTRSLDIRAASEPQKTILLARDDNDRILAWGLVGDDRTWDEDAQTLALSAAGVESSWLGRSIIAPASARTAPLIVNGVPNASLNTSLTGWSLGTIGKKLVAQRLAWPGAPTPFILPADETGVHERNYAFTDFKMIGDALSDLSEVEGGPDFAFDAQRAPDGLSLVYPMRHGTAANPRLGQDRGSWSLGDQSPISGLKVTDSTDSFATAVWMASGKSEDITVLSRVLNADLVSGSGYPPTDLVDTSRNDISRQATLDGHAIRLAEYARGYVRSLSFTVRGDAKPGLGEFAPGDTVLIDVPPDHPYLVESFTVRITGIKGDETGLDMAIECEVI